MKITKEIIKDYPYGPIKTIHSIGAYDVIEYTRMIFNNNCSTGKHDMKNTRFHMYINGEDTNHGSASLDGALVTAIAIKHEGYHTRADTYFMKIILSFS